MVIKWYTLHIGGKIMAQTTSYKKQRVPITELLQNSIKTLRKQYNKRGDILSKELDKGASYISQIENGKIKEIDFDSLMCIFKAIYSVPEVEFIKLFSSYIDSLLIEQTKSQLVKENWIHIFLVQEIPYPVTDWVINFIQNKLNSLGKSPYDLIQEINRNHQLQSWYYGSNYYPNKAYVIAQEPSVYDSLEEFKLSITTVYKLEDNYIDDILNRKITSINYINMEIIFRQLFSMESDYLPSVLEKVSKIMIDNNFLNTFERYDFLQRKNSSIVSENSQEFIFYDKLVTNYKEKYQKLKSEVFDKIDDSLENYYRANSAYSCETIDKMLKNFDSDPGLMLAILSASVYEIPMDFHYRFMEDFRSLLKKYSKIDPYQ